MQAQRSFFQEKTNSYSYESSTQRELEVLNLTEDVYVLIGGQLFAPHTRAKWILGSGAGNAIFNFGSFLEYGLVTAPIALRFDRRMPFSISLRAKGKPPMM